MNRIEWMAPRRATVVSDAREGEAPAEPFGRVSVSCLLCFWRTAHGVCLLQLRVGTVG